MSLEGMDVDQARSLAQRLDANAQTLNRIAAMLAALTAELGHYWQGAASATFQQQWSASYRPALAGAVSALEQMHAHLLANIEQQVQASSTDSADDSDDGPARVVLGLTLTSVLGGIGRVWGVAEKAGGYQSLLTEPIERLKQLDDESTLLRFQNSPILNWLHDNEQVQQVDRLLSNEHLTEVLDKADKVGWGLSVLSIGVSGAEALHNLGQHHYAAATGEVIDGTATGLKNSDDPVLYLAGFDVSLLQKDYELGRQIQWNDIPSPFNLSNFENDYIPVFKSLPGELVSTLAEIM